MPPICETTCGASSAAAIAAQLQALRSAGEVQFNGLLANETFVFTQVGSETHPITLAGAVLDPLSTDFVMSGPATLQYTGSAPKRFYVSYSLLFLWTDATGGITEAAFIAQIVKNGNVIPSPTSPGETSNGSFLDRGAENDTAFGHSSQTLLELAPGDTLQVGVGVVLIAATFTIQVLALTLVAHEV